MNMTSEPSREYRVLSYGGCVAWSGWMARMMVQRAWGLIGTAQDVCRAHADTRGWLSEANFPLAPHRAKFKKIGLEGKFKNKIGQLEKKLRKSGRKEKGS